jgi:hypothetical protein
MKQEVSQPCSQHPASVPIWPDERSPRLHTVLTSPSQTAWDQVLIVAYSLQFIQQIFFVRFHVLTATSMKFYLTTRQ